MSSSTLQKEFDYYLAHQDELLAKYAGKYIAIKDGEVLGEFDRELDAVTQTQKDHAIGTFLVQFVSPGNTAYTQAFHSRVAFR